MSVVMSAFPISVEEAVYRVLNSVEPLKKTSLALDGDADALIGATLAQDGACSIASLFNFIISRFQSFLFLWVNFIF